MLWQPLSATCPNQSIELSNRRVFGQYKSTQMTSRIGFACNSTPIKVPFLVTASDSALSNYDKSPRYVELSARDRTQSPALFTKLISDAGCFGISELML